MKNLVEQAERIKNAKRNFTNFSRPFDSEENDSPPKLAGEIDDPKLMLNFDVKKTNPYLKDARKNTPTTSNEYKSSESGKNNLAPSKYDFYKLNKQRWGVNQNNIIEVQKLPKEIDNIYQMKSENDANILRSIPLNFSEKRKIQSMMDDMKTFISSDDEIHTFSCVCEPLEEELKEANIDIGIPYYLHLSSLSRELISNRKTPDDDVKYDQKVLDFLNEKDYQISAENLKIDDLFNILSGRISDKILLRLFSGQEIHPLFEDFSEDNNINIRLPFDMTNENNDKREGSKQKSQKSSISQDLVKMFQKKYSTRYGSSILQKTPTFTSRSLQEIYDEIGYPLDQLQHEIIEMNTVVQNNYSSWQDSDGLNMNKIGGLNKIDEEDETDKERKKKMILGHNKFQAVGIQVDVDNDDNKSSNSSDDDKKSAELEEEEFQGYRMPMKGFKKSVTILLKEISELKDAKRNSLNMVNSQVMMKYIAEINAKIEQRLKDLLNLIMERDLEEVEEVKEDKEEHKINDKVEDIDGININNNNSLADSLNKRNSDISLRCSNNNKNLTDKNDDEFNDIVEDECEVKRLKERDKMKEDLKKNLKIVVKDIDKLQGKFIDGHLKTKLLFQFLKEYRKLQEEKQEEKMILLEESAIIKEDGDNPFENHLNNALEKENHQGESFGKFKRMESKHPTVKNLNLKTMNKGWDINKNQVFN